MKIRMFSMFALAVASVFAGELDNGFLRGATDKRAIDYAPGEPMTFTLKLDGVKKLPEGQWFIQWERFGDDGKKCGERVPAALEKPVVIKTSLDRPGFVRVRAQLVDGKGQVYRKKYTGDTTTPEGKRAQNEFERSDRRIFFDGGAGVQIDKLVSYPEPKDFDAFWAKQADRLKLVPIKADRIELPCSNPKARLYAVQIACAGLRPVTGYLSVPKAVEQGATFPCRLETHGYSGDTCRHDAPGWARDNEIVLNINAHGQKLPAFGATEADRKALRWEIRSHDCSYAFDAKQNEDPEVAYFNGMVLRVKRALQYLKTLPGWSADDLGGRLRRGPHARRERHHLVLRHVHERQAAQGPGAEPRERRLVHPLDGRDGLLRRRELREAHPEDLHDRHHARRPRRLLLPPDGSRQDVQQHPRQQKDLVGAGLDARLRAAGAEPALLDRRHGEVG